MYVFVCECMSHAYGCLQKHEEVSGAPGARVIDSLELHAMGAENLKVILITEPPAPDVAGCSGLGTSLAVRLGVRLHSSQPFLPCRSFSAVQWWQPMITGEKQFVLIYHVSVRKTEPGRVMEKELQYHELV